ARQKINVRDNNAQVSELRVFFIVLVLSCVCFHKKDKIKAPSVGADEHINQDILPVSRMPASPHLAQETFTRHRTISIPA
ncbi:MAG: hypothetical protein J6R20_09685, partial [Clostridia bacterium]|nr:hypothetical protein [Clostridia bacterium]